MYRKFKVKTRGVKPVNSVAKPMFLNGERVVLLGRSHSFLKRFNGKTVLLANIVCNLKYKVSFKATHSIVFANVTYKFLGFIPVKRTLYFCLDKFMELLVSKEEFSKFENGDLDHKETFEKLIANKTYNFGKIVKL